MKTEKEIVDQITKYEKEITELKDLQEHCAGNGWWPVVAEVKKIVSTRTRDVKQLQAILVN